MTKSMPAREPFDPWTAAWDLAVSLEHERGFAVGPDGPMAQWLAAQQVKELRGRIESAHGTGFDVLEAAATCALHGLAMPEWLAAAFLRRYRAVQQLRVGSWDDPAAFGPPYPKSAQLAALRRRRMSRLKVVEAVERAISAAPERPIDDDFWESVGKTIGEGKSSAQERHAEAVQMGLTERPKSIRARLNAKHCPARLRKLAGTKRKR